VNKNLYYSVDHPTGLVEKVLMLVYSMDNTIVRPMAVGAYGGTPGRNALRPYGIWAVYLKIRMLILPKIFESIRDHLHRCGFSTSPTGGFRSPGLRQRT